MSKTEKELVDHPPHYTKGKFEHVEVVENYQMSPHMKDATKYLMRTSKGNLLLDTQKCRWYICRMIERPWTVQAEYPRSEVRDEFKAEDVALDWFPEKGDRYYALMQLFTAMDSTTPGRIVEHLMIARDHVDVELRKLLKDDQTENNQA